MRYVFKKKFYIFLISFVDFLGNILVLPFRLFRHRTPGNVGNILLIRLDHMGDMISSTPIPQNLKYHYRGAKITFLVASWTKEIVINDPYVDEVVCYDAPWFVLNRKKIFEFKRFFKLAAELHKHKYDLGFDLRGDFRHILLMTLAGVKFRVGYGVTGGGFLLNRQVDYREDVHAIEHSLDLLRGVGMDIKVHKPRIYDSERERESVRALFKASKLTDKDFIVAMHPHPGHPANRWLDDRFAELIDWLHNEYNAKVILIGSLKDKDSNDKIISISKTQATNAAGKTSLGALAALLKMSYLFIGVNSGPAHLAASVDIPMVVLFSGSNIIQDWGPRSDKAVIIQKDISCKDCERLDCRDNICMDLISVDDVIEAVGTVIGCR